MSLPDTIHSENALAGPLIEADLHIAMKACKLPLPTRIAFVGNYLPRECGIATFTTDLCTALATEYGEERLFAIPVNDPESSYDYPKRVRLELTQEDLASYERAADFLNFNGNDLVCLQHEYGIYGGTAGSHILALLRKLTMPLVTTLHTVLREPDANQRIVLEEIARHQRNHAMPLRETNHFAPVDRGKIPVRNALDSLRSQFRAHERTQQFEFARCLQLEARRGKGGRGFGHKGEFFCAAV